MRLKSYHCNICINDSYYLCEKTKIKEKHIVKLCQKTVITDEVVESNIYERKYTKIPKT